MKRKLLMWLFTCIVFTWCSLPTNQSQNIEQNEWNIKNIISWSDTLASHRDILEKSIFESNTREISISKKTRNVILRGTTEDIKNKWITIEAKTGTVVLSLMTYNPKLTNSLEAKYKWPFGNNIIKYWEKIEFSKNTLSGNINEDDKYVFILIGNISTETAILNYTIEKNK